MRIFPYRRSIMILPNPGTTELQEYIADGTMCLDISNNLSQETNRSDNNIVDYDNMCVVCLESNEKKRNITLPCDHTFHAYCIIKWLSVQRRNDNTPCCPVCKQTCEYENLVEDIVSANFSEVEDIIKKLDCIDKYCSRQQLREYGILRLKRNYMKLRSILTDLKRNGVKDPINCDYIYISVVPLPEMVIKLFGDAQDIAAETKAKTTSNCNVISVLYKKLVCNLKRRIKCLTSK